MPPFNLITYYQSEFRSKDRHPQALPPVIGNFDMHLCHKCRADFKIYDDRGSYSIFYACGDTAEEMFTVFQEYEREYNKELIADGFLPKKLKFDISEVQKMYEEFLKKQEEKHMLFSDDDFEEEKPLWNVYKCKAQDGWNIAFITQSKLSYLGNDYDDRFFFQDNSFDINEVINSANNLETEKVYFDEDYDYSDDIYDEFSKDDFISFEQLLEEITQEKQYEDNYER